MKEHVQQVRCNNFAIDAINVHFEQYILVYYNKQEYVVYSYIRINQIFCMPFQYIGCFLYSTFEFLINFVWIDL